MTTTTGGHGGFRSLSGPPRAGGQFSATGRDGGSAIADSEDEVPMRVREQFIQGACQMKLVECGGVSRRAVPWTG
ncbi:hypothetical protein [Paraburkholderia sp. SG-MS1]|uniref:hypothetical protein n=1 Tax=Paraburkholderia sp. SG-MS1 TaxID=2023741 RepID=UPI001EEBCCB7|nr:hypothetical protein [Paraburkholderia sp. SG-MS1]